jgi:UDP-glucose 4-epimerase
MRVVVIGATGNLGTSLVEVLRDEPAVTDLVGVARRLPQVLLEGVTWQPADIARDDLRPVVAGADVVIVVACPKSASCACALA